MQEVVNDTVTMDTPQQEATSSRSVTIETESSSNNRCIKDDYNDVTSLSGVVCGESSDSGLITVKCEECERDISLEEWIDYTYYYY